MLSLRSMELHVSSAHWYSLESEYVPGDFAAWMNAFPLLYRYGSVRNLYGSDFFPQQDTAWFPSFPGTVKSVRNTASTIRCDFWSDAVGKTADPSGTEWKASHFPSVLVGSRGRNHRSGYVREFSGYL